MIASTCNTRQDFDFGLSLIANFLDKEESLALYWSGAAEENKGNVDGAIKIYKRAFKQWPALDSITVGGLPIAVRQEAVELGFNACPLLDIIDVELARKTCVYTTDSLLTTSDLADIEQVSQSGYRPSLIYEMFTFFNCLTLLIQMCNRFEKMQHLMLVILRMQPICLRLQLFSMIHRNLHFFLKPLILLKN